MAPPLRKLKGKHIPAAYDEFYERNFGGAVGLSVYRAVPERADQVIVEHMANTGLRPPPSLELLVDVTELGTSTAEPQRGVPFSFAGNAHENMDCGEPGDNHVQLRTLHAELLVESSPKLISRTRVQMRHYAAVAKEEENPTEWAAFLAGAPSLGWDKFAKRQAE